MQTSQSNIIGCNDNNVSVIDVVPIEHSDSSNESPIAITIPADNVASSPSATQNINNIVNNVETSDGTQQVIAQVAVVQPQSPDDTGPHYITVSG